MSRYESATSSNNVDDAYQGGYLDGYDDGLKTASEIQSENEILRKRVEDLEATLNAWEHGL